jgi:rare lipoprotein A
MALNRTLSLVSILVLSISLQEACSVVSSTYRLAKGTVRTTYAVSKGAIGLVVGTGKLAYHIGEFTYQVVKAPLTWPLTHEEIETIDDVAPKAAIQQGRVKRASYVVHGKRYVPMSAAEAMAYREVGIASWYGTETLRQKGGRMTANGEVFDPMGLSAAHKYLPLPTFVRVTNLDNQRSVIVRVNDRGPFVKGRIIDVSAAAAKRLGFRATGLARVRVESVKL